MAPMLLTSMALLAFAANSILCRMALGQGAIDAASFTSIRLLSGAAMLAGILLYRQRGFAQERINPLSALMLFTYAVCFSFAYVKLSTGTGALILFGSVQLSMFIIGVATGERHGIRVWLGVIAAFGGLVYLLLPSINAPPLLSALLMMLAGASWSLYTIRGKGSANPLAVTGWNFIGTVPLVLLTALVFHVDAHLTADGITLAVLSGALASGIGYVIWYSALPYLTPTTAATVQLSVPVIAAIGGITLLSEPVTPRLLIASLVILGSIYLVINAATTRPE